MFMRGNDELNESKLEGIFGTSNLRPATAEELKEFTGAEHGSIGPIDLKSKNVKIIADNLLKDANGLISGANKDGYHIKNIDFRRDAEIEEYHDLRVVQSGEPCVECGRPLRVVKAIELGHIFKLGTKYSEAMEATFLDTDGKEKPIIMGSYGIGVERILACFIEQNFDENGLKWKAPVTPFHVHLIGLGMSKFDEVRNACEELYSKISGAGYEVLFDDRDESPGVKFNDADLLGIPLQIIGGNKNLKNGNVEIKDRATGERDVVSLDEAIESIARYYNK
jgi:prolyl-tRNA synthetase